MIECDRVMLSINIIIVATCGDFEENSCSVCKELLQSNDSNVRNIIVDNPRAHTDWSHLHCWNENHPLMSELFQSGIFELTMSAFHHFMESSPSILGGWIELNCADQWKFLPHIFSTNVSPFLVTLRHVIVFVPCKSDGRPIITVSPVQTIPRDEMTRTDSSDLIRHEVLQRPGNIKWVYLGMYWSPTYYHT